MCRYLMAFEFCDIFLFWKENNLNKKSDLKNPKIDF